MAENEVIKAEETAVEPETVTEETVVAEEAVVAEENVEEASTGSKVGAWFKERWRKFLVNLKRRPQNIAFIFLAAITIFNLLALQYFSMAIITYAELTEWVGLMVFINTLFSILVLVLYLNAFPKLKKKGSKTVVSLTEKGLTLNINLVMIGIMVAMIAAMIACEIVYSNLMGAFYTTEYVNKGEAGSEAGLLINHTMLLSTVHIVLLAIFLVLLFTLPLYRKLILKIDTSIKVESATENIQSIDLQD